MSTGMSLHLGLNRVSAAHYGSDKPLRGCHNDATDMSQIASSQGFTPTVLLDEDATADAVLSYLRDAAAKLTAGDAFVLSYAGHGSQVSDQTGDEDQEDDGQDETWLLFDRMFIDDEISTALAEFQPGVRILVVSDSCHSGTIVGRLAQLLGGLLDGVGRLFGRAMPTWVFRTPSIMASFGASVRQRHLELYQSIAARLPHNPTSLIRAAVIQLSACKDEQLAADGDPNGLFTRRLKSVWSGGAFEGTHPEFLQQIAAQMSDLQTPVIAVLGEDTKSFVNQRPFTVAAPTNASAIASPNQ